MRLEVGEPIHSALASFEIDRLKAHSPDLPSEMDWPDTQFMGHLAHCDVYSLELLKALDGYIRLE